MGNKIVADLRNTRYHIGFRSCQRATGPGLLQRRLQNGDTAHLRETPAIHTIISERAKPFVFLIPSHSWHANRNWPQRFPR